MSETTASSGAELMKRFVASSPFAQKLGITVVDVTENGASLELGFDPSLATADAVVHGGVIATLADSVLVAKALATYRFALAQRGDGR